MRAWLLFAVMLWPLVAGCADPLRAALCVRGCCLLSRYGNSLRDVLTPLRVVLCPSRHLQRWDPITVGWQAWQHPSARIPSTRSNRSTSLATIREPTRSVSPANAPQPQPPSSGEQRAQERRLGAQTRARAMWD
jgi:hypothetical protein